MNKKTQAKRKLEAERKLEAAYASAHATFCAAIEDCCVVHAPTYRTYRAALDAADADYHVALDTKEQP